MAARMPVELYLEDDDGYVNLVADGGVGRKFVVTRLQESLLANPKINFVALQVDVESFGANLLIGLRSAIHRMKR